VGGDIMGTRKKVEQLEEAMAFLIRGITSAFEMIKVQSDMSTIQIKVQNVNEQRIKGLEDRVKTLENKGGTFEFALEDTIEKYDDVLEDLAKGEVDESG
jgi:hypothetical protein